MILLNDFRRHVASMSDELHEATDRVLGSGWFILGEEVQSFERELAAFLGVRHVIGVGNGMDAIQIALAAVGVQAGDEVVTTPNSAFASTLAVMKLGAVPRFVDLDPSTCGLDVRRIGDAVGPKTRAILPVHIYGQALDATALEAIARETGVALVNDAAQAHGARWRGRDVAQYGIATAYSFYPTKNLGCLGDGGAIATNDDAVAQRARCARDYGQERRYVHVDPRGLNSRLDELQAAILRVKLRHLPAHNARRAAVARRYTESLRDLPLQLTSPPAESLSVHHLFTVRTPKRDALMAHLREHGVQSAVHYPVIIPMQQAARAYGYVPGSLPIAERCAAELLSLPIHAELTDDEVEAVSSGVREFFR